MNQSLMNHYHLIYADPAWNFKTYSKKGEGRSPKYTRMTIQQIKELPVSDISYKDSILLMWVTDPFLQLGFDVLKYWGFTYKTVGFYWVKENAKSPGWHMGNGYYTRANPEQCLLARKGKGLPRLNKDVPRLIVSPVGEHSAKPHEVYPRIDRLFGDDYPRLEMFARNNWPGWDSWGNQVENSINLLG